MNRYIEANAIVKSFKDMAKEPWNQQTGTTWANAFGEAADLVDGCPTADVTEVKHGYWIYERQDDMFKCSKCGGYAVRNDYPYCMWCGTKMDLEEVKDNEISV